ncbi:MAG: Fic/DOC family N-terminal domain-containing protein [Candidatus Sulfotelmatobacter sp.]
MDCENGPERYFRPQEDGCWPTLPTLPARKYRSGATPPLCPALLPPELNWTARLIGALSDTDRLVGRLADEGGRVSNRHILIRPFVQREAVLSSKIEGTQATLGELLAAEAGAIVDRSP